MDITNIHMREHLINRAKSDLEDMSKDDPDIVVTEAAVIEHALTLIDLSIEELFPEAVDSLRDMRDSL